MEHDRADRLTTRLLTGSSALADVNIVNLVPLSVAKPVRGWDQLPEGTAHLISSASGSVTKWDTTSSLKEVKLRFSVV